MENNIIPQGTEDYMGLVMTSAMISQGIKVYIGMAMESTMICQGTEIYIGLTMKSIMILQGTEDNTGLAVKGSYATNYLAFHLWALRSQLLTVSSSVYDVLHGTSLTIVPEDLGGSAIPCRTYSNPLPSDSGKKIEP